VEKVKRGRIVAVRDPKTIEVLELRVGYAKDRFGKLCRQDIKRPNVLAFMRSNATPTRAVTDTSEGVSSALRRQNSSLWDSVKTIRSTGSFCFPNVNGAKARLAHR
jgi:hypothetical protein